MLSGKGKTDSFPDIDEAVQREFQALREFLINIEQVPANGNGKTSGAKIIGPGTNGHKRAWWIVLQGVERLPLVAAVRERLEKVPGCLAAQVVSLSPNEIRLSVTTTGQVDQRQLEFVVAACGDVPSAKVIARGMRSAA